MWSIGCANRGSPEPDGSPVVSETGEMAKAIVPAAGVAVTWQACGQKVPQQSPPFSCRPARTSGPAGEGADS